MNRNLKFQSEIPRNPKQETEILLGVYVNSLEFGPVQQKFECDDDDDDDDDYDYDERRRERTNKAA